MNEERRCLVVDEHPTIRMGVRGLLDGRYEVEEAEDGRGALEMLAYMGEFDVVIVELAGTNGDRDVDAITGVAAIRALRKARPGLGIVAHAPRPERHGASAAIDAGATAYVAKSSSADSLKQAVDAAADAEPFVDPAAKGRGNGSSGLTRRQRQILQLYANGNSTTAVATRLGVSNETVRTHTKAILARLEARDRAHAVAIGIRSALIS